MIEFLKKFYFRTTGYSYTNLGRLFLRLFTGVMLLQFGVRQISHFASMSEVFPSVLGLSPTACMTLMIIIEIGCSIFIMCGFLTRLSLLPPIVAMVIAEVYLLGHIKTGEVFYQLDWQQPAYLPIMFLGIFLFLLIVGPGKISVDYFLSLHLIHKSDQSEEELEEV